MTGVRWTDRCGSDGNRAGDVMAQALRWLASVALLGGCAAEPTVTPFSEHERFDDVAAARAAGLFADGWVPAVLPPDAGPIDSARDATRPGHCARGVFDPSARPSVESGLLDYGFDAERDALPPRAGCPFAPPAGEGARRFRNSDGPDENDRFAVVGDGVLWIFDPVAQAVAPGSAEREAPR